MPRHAPDGRGTRPRALGRRCARGLALCGLLCGGAAPAAEMQFAGLEAQLRSTLSFGAAIRTEQADPRLIGKLDLNPGLCGPGDCISFTGDAAQNEKLVRAPGAFFGANKDQGDLNYSRGGLVAAVSRLKEELVVSRGNLQLKLGALGYYDAANYSKDERHPDTTFQPPSAIRSAAVRQQLGRDWQLTDAFITGLFNLLGQDFTASAGYQHVRWGESSFVALNSLSQINPPNAVLLHQPGTAVGDVFRPTPLLLLGTQFNSSLSLDLLYELGWTPAVADPGGSFYSTVNVLKADFADLSLGAFHVDPNGIGRLPPPGNLISDTSLSIQMLNEHYGHPRSSGQFGGKLSYYAADFNGGTEFSAYALNYHSQLPYLSAFSTRESCMRDATSFAGAFLDCNGFIGLNPVSGKEPLPLDSARIFADYPENIQMFGASFNTNLGRWSLAGEYSIRPNLPLQVDISDILFASIQPSFPRQDLTIGLDPGTIEQTIASLGGVIGQISTSNPAQLLQDAAGALRHLPAILGVVGGGTATIPSARAAAPDYLEGYRGVSVQPQQLIRGYQRFAVDQLDLTGLRAIGSSDNLLGADQILILGEIGFTHVWHMPARSALQLEGGDANGTHASPGADGSGSGGVPDTRRLNPTQQTHGFASAFSWGYRTLIRFEYDNVLWNLNFKPWLMWSQDMSGIAPQPMQNFIAGTKQYALGTVIESGQQWSGQLFYQGSTGGGTVNTLRDRDVVGFSVAYTF